MGAPAGGVSIKRREFMGRRRCPRPSSRATSSEASPATCRISEAVSPTGSNLLASVALLFCTFDAVLTHPDNDFVLQQLEQLRFELHNLDDTAAFESLLATLSQRHSGHGAHGRVRARDDGGVRRRGPGLAACCSVRRLAARSATPRSRGRPSPVWASSTNAAVVTVRKAVLKHEDVSMAVLCQPVVQARYAFVLHTTNPQTSDPNEIYGEVVCGDGRGAGG